MKLLVAALTVLVANSSQAPATGRIAFERTSGETVTATTTDVFSVRADGKGLRRITSVDNVEAASWSPDRTQIAFARQTATGVTAVYVVRSNGGGLRRLTSPAVSSAGPSWSSDGLRLAYTRTPPSGVAEVWVSDLAGKSQRLAVGSDPAWDPIRGRRLAYRAAGGVFVRVVGGRPLRVSAEQGIPAAWTPDGKRIALVVDSGIVSVSASPGGVQKVISRTGGQDPAWSPDAKRIVWSMDGDLWIASATGSARRKLAATRFSDVQPEWSPDGRRVVFTATIGDSCRLYVVAASGGAVRPLVAPPAGANGCDRRPVWLSG